MNDKMKDAGEKFILRWLWTERGKNEDGSMIYNMDLIPSAGLLEELIQYHRLGNFDRVMAFMQLMFSIEERYDSEIVSEPSHSLASEYLVTNITKMFGRKRR